MYTVGAGVHGGAGRDAGAARPVRGRPADRGGSQGAAGVCPTAGGGCRRRCLPDGRQRSLCQGRERGLPEGW